MELNIKLYCDLLYKDKLHEPIISIWKYIVYYLIRSIILYIYSYYTIVFSEFNSIKLFYGETKNNAVALLFLGITEIWDMLI